MENNNNNSFWQFSDQLRLQGSNFTNLSINDTVWRNTNNTNNTHNTNSSFTSKRVEERRNFDIRVGGDRVGKQGKVSEFNGVSNGWKVEKSVLNKGVVYSKYGSNKSYNFSKKNQKEEEFESKSEKKSYNYSNYTNKDTNSNNNNNNNNNNNSNKSNVVVDKRFKTLPASEALPRNEVVGGYIFVCNNDTMEENLKRQLFGLPPRYRDSVRAITPGLPLFLYNYSTHQLHGIFEAASFGGTNIDPTAWEDKKCPGESRFPAQVRVAIRKICNPLEEDSFRPILHHYDGPKFRLELNIPEALALLDIFADTTPEKFT